MNVLFHIEPLVFHGRPLHYWALFDFFTMLAKNLDADVRFVSNPALIQRARQQLGLASGKLYTIPGPALSDAAQMSAMETLRALQYGDAPLTARLAELYRDALGGFVPDVVITISPAPYWKAAFPSVTLLHVDGGLFSRAPLPHVFFLDSEGMFANSTPALHADEWKALPATPSDKAMIALLRAEFRQRIVVESPFHDLERDLRAKYKRLLLLPLQFAGEFGFDLHCNYDRQGSFLLDVVERVSPDTAVIVTEHPTALWLGDLIDPDTRDYVSRAHPNVVFAPGAREGVNHAGQMLLHHADAVASVSSSMGMQAVFFGKPLLALGHSHLTTFATWHSMVDYESNPAAGEDPVAALAWLMRHYYLPTQLCAEKNFLTDYLCRRATLRPNRGLGQYPSFVSDERLVTTLFRGTPIAA